MRTGNNPSRGVANVLLAFGMSLGIALGGCGAQTDPDYIAETDVWHAERIDRLTQETGWLTLVGLHPLHQGQQRLGSATDNDVQLPAAVPAAFGVIEVRESTIALAIADRVTVQVDGQGYTGPADAIPLRSDAVDQPTLVTYGTLQMYVISRGGGLFLRVKDSASEVRRTFRGIDRFAVDGRWRVNARLEGQPMTVAVPNVLGQTEETASPGTLVFELAGRVCRLVPFGSAGEPLQIVFGDATNGLTTYGGGRFLNVAAPAADGTVVLDFNRAYNPPCVFTPYATCSLPPEGNRLPLAVQAGEKMWGEHH